MTDPKNYKEFLQTLEGSAPPKSWAEALQAMWHDLKGNWEASHNIAQEMHNRHGSWIHAYLHRQEGDEFNAGYWYRQAGREFPKKNLKEEQRELVEYFLMNG